MKKLISIFLLIIISIQCLPVKELGKCIYESSFVEEDLCDNVEKKEMKDFSKEFYSHNHCIDTTFSHIILGNSEPLFLYQNPFADLSIQPPNA